MILVDTGPLIALCDPRDSLHRRALRQIKVLARSPLVVCEPVLTEACFHLAAPSQRARLREVLRQLDILPALVDDPQALWVEVFGWLNHYSEHEPDFADGYLAVLCGRDRRCKIWTYDTEFRTIWRKPDGSPIPMAAKP